MLHTSPETRLSKRDPGGTVLTSSSQGGISSLAGFAYQIKVFALELARLDPASVVQFETLDDVVVEPGSIAMANDEHFESFLGSVPTESGKRLIQAKRTSVTAVVKRRVLLNWLVAVADKPDQATSFILVSTSQFNLSANDPEVSDLALEDHMAEGETKPRSLEGQALALFRLNQERFRETADYIRKRMAPDWTPDIDKRLWTAYEGHLHYQGQQDFVYELRLNQFLARLALDILESVSRGKPYQCDNQKRNALAEQIVQSVTNESPVPDFSIFKKTALTPYDPTGPEPRELRQLRACKISEARVWEHFTYGLYYESARRQHLLSNRTTKVDSLEETTKDNFDSVVENLAETGTDSPRLRLDGTKSRSNSYATNEQIRWGACIYLTSEDTAPTRQISWDDSAR